MSKRTNAEDRVLKISQGHVDCRTYLHAWRPTDVTLDGAHFIQHLQCRRCQTRKEFKINKFTGAIVGSPKYDYADGYLIDGGRLTASERGSLRLVAVQQTPRHIRGKRGA
jgi:hypothetical protein